LKEADVVVNGGLFSIAHDVGAAEEEGVAFHFFSQLKPPAVPRFLFVAL